MTETDPWAHAPIRPWAERVPTAELLDELLLRRHQSREEFRDIEPELLELLDVLSTELGELLAALEAVFDPVVLEVSAPAGVDATLVLAAAVPLEARHATALARWFTRLAVARAEREGEGAIGGAIARRLRARGLIRLEP